MTETDSSRHSLSILVKFETSWPVRYWVTATRLRPPAQGCRFGYPRLTRFGECPTATRLRLFLIRRGNDATALRLNHISFAIPG